MFQQLRMLTTGSLSNNYLFVLFIAAWAIFQLSGSCHHYRWRGCKFRPMLGAQGLWAGRDLYRATPILRHGTSVYTVSSERPAPTSHSGVLTPQLKDHQIFEPDALTTAPRGRLTNKLMLQGYNESRLKSSFRKFYGRYDDFVCDYKFAEWLVSYNLLDCHFHTGLDDG